MAKRKTSITINGLVEIGHPFPWPLNVAPDRHLKCNGAAFDPLVYPELALVYPDGVLPDLRGEFIRGWDDGRGVDASRALLSLQGDAIRNITGSMGNGGSDPFGIYYAPYTSGAFYNSNRTNLNWPGSTSGTLTDRADKIAFDASRQVPTAAENRPRNVAFNYIVRAL